MYWTVIDIYGIFKSITLTILTISSLKAKITSIIWHCSYWKLKLRITKRKFWGPKALKFSGEWMPYTRVRSVIANPDKNATLGTPLWKTAGYAPELMFLVLLLSTFFFLIFSMTCITRCYGSHVSQARKVLTLPSQDINGALSEKHSSYNKHCYKLLDCK